MPVKVNATKVLVVDDHPLFRRGVVRLIEGEPDLTVCAEADDVASALRAVEEAAPHLVLADLSLRNSSGIDLLRDIRLRHPRLPVLILSMHSEVYYAERVLRAGARGYLTKAEPLERVLDAIRAVLRGEVFATATVANRTLRRRFGQDSDAEPGLPLDCLSDREFEIFVLIGRGGSAREIATRCHLSVKTVETHRENIKRKLNLPSAGVLLQKAIEFVGAEEGQ